EYEMNVLLECSRKQIFMKEIPIETIYRNENVGSHFHPWKDSCMIYKEILKFSASSFLSFLLDYGMYSAFLWVMRGTAKGFSVLCSNVAARIISGCFNYHINRKLVFQKETNTTAMAAEYVFLAAGILAGNTLILELFVGAGMNRYVAKPCTELLFFMISWFVQRTFIFKQKKTRILKC
ncbi:GtrA family protein, partial [[Ruminococcus] torques]